MKRPVCLFPLMNILRPFRPDGGLLGFRKKRGGEIGGGLFEGKRFQRGPHLRDLAQFRDVEGCDANALVRLAECQPFSLEPPEGFTHRHMAYAEFLGNMILPQPRSGL